MIKKRYIGFFLLVLAFICMILPGKITKAEGTDDFEVDDYGVLTDYYGSDTEVTIPDNVTEIGSGAFRDSGLIEKVTIPDGVTLIGDDAFSGCSNLNNVVIPATVETIGKGAFMNCEALQSIELPSNVTEIDEQTFYHCISLKNVTCPGVEKIETEAFDSCYSLETMDWPTSLKEVGTFAFYDCNSLTEAAFVDGLETLGDEVFNDCDNLSKITIPKSVTSIGEGLCAFCPSLEEIDVDVDNVNFASRDSNAIIDTNSESIIAGCNMTNWDKVGQIKYIGMAAFAGCKTMSNFTMPNTVEEIGQYAFSECEDLTEVELTENVKVLGKEAFSKCTGLVSITLPDSLEEIGESAFSKCAKLKEIDIPKGVTAIGEQFVSYCADLEKLTVDEENAKYYSDANDGLIIEKYTKVDGEFNNIIAGCSKSICPDDDKIYYIGKYAFLGCDKLENFTISDQVWGIEEKAFCECKNLSKVEFSNGENATVYIRDNAFASCPKLAEVILPETMEMIGTKAFLDCESLKEITVPKSVVIIEDKAFGYVTDLMSLNNDCIPIDDFTIKSYADSEAQYYAESEEFTFVDLDNPNGSNPTETNPTQSNPTSSNPTPTNQAPNNQTPINQTPAPQLTQPVIPPQAPIVPTTTTNIGSTYNVNRQNFTVTSNNTVMYTGAASSKVAGKTKKLTVPDTIKKNGKTYKVTSIANNAFKKFKKMTCVNLGKNINSIGKGAFAGCKNLKVIKISATKLKKIQKGAFQGINKKAKFIVPKKYKKQLKKLLNSSTGFKKTMKIA